LELRSLTPVLSGVDAWWVEAMMIASLLLVLSLAGPPGGEYYSGDGLGVNWTVSLTEEGRFEFAWHGCLGLYDSNEGPFALDGAWSH
jgi:hypothetical protein